MRAKEIRDANNKGLKLLIFAEPHRGSKSAPLAHRYTSEAVMHYTQHFAVLLSSTDAARIRESQGGP